MATTRVAFDEEVKTWLEKLKYKRDTFYAKGGVCIRAWYKPGQRGVRRPGQRYYCRQFECSNKNEYVVAMTCPPETYPEDLYSKCPLFGKASLRKDENNYVKEGDFGCYDIWQTDINNYSKTGLNQLRLINTNEAKQFYDREWALYER